MPYQSRKVPKKDCYRVTNRKTRRIFAKCTTKENARKQMILLRAIKYNKNFVPRSKSSRNKTQQTK